MGQFNPCSALTDESAEYNKKPRSSDKVHCLVSVVAADKISLMSNDVIVKMRKVREKASELGELFQPLYVSLCLSVLMKWPLAEHSS